MKVNGHVIRILTVVFLGALVVLTPACHSGITRTGYQLPADAGTTKTDKCPIAIQSNAKFDPDTIDILGSIHSYDTGFSVDCDEAYCLDIFCREGCLLGADVINITEEKQPDFWSTCYRARAEFVRFKDRSKAVGLYSDARYAPNLIIERSVKSNKRTRDMIIGTVAGGALGALITWEVTAPHGH